MFKRDFWTSSRVRLNLFTGTEELRENPMWKEEEIITEKKFDQMKDAQSKLEQKLNLILDHLELKYVPETEKKEAAKLEKKSSLNLGSDFGLTRSYIETCLSSGGDGGVHIPPNYTLGEKPKKKEKKFSTKKRKK